MGIFVLTLSSLNVHFAIVYALLQALVYKELSGKGNPQIEPKVKNFYRYLYTLNPRACKAVAANLGYAPSTRWMKVLNSRERPDCIYSCDVSNCVKRMEAAIKQRIIHGVTPAFSIAIDATKVSGVLDISTLYKSIHGGAYPHHNISTVDVTSKRIEKILDQNPPAGVLAVEIANKVKVGIMIFAKSPSGTSPFEIIGA